MTVQDGSKPERLRRGSIPPYLKLTEAFNLARDVYEQGGGKASLDMMSRLTGNSSSSSTFIKKINALKLYGLVSDQGSSVELTDQGRAIAAPISHDSDRQARKSSFLSVPVFNKLFDRLKGKLLPVDEFLRNIVEQEIGVPKEFSSDWLAYFKEGARVSGLLFDRNDGKTQVLESPAADAGTDAVRPIARDAEIPINASLVTDVSSQPILTGTQSVPIAASGNITRFDLSDGRVAEFNIPFGITSRDAKRLKGFLKGLEFIIDSGVVGEEDSS